MHCSHAGLYLLHTGMSLAFEVKLTHLCYRRLRYLVLPNACKVTVQTSLNRTHLFSTKISG